jgi:NADH-quinone oxidoreductase subunit J
VLAVVSALLVVLLRRPVHVALGLLAHSLSVAALYMTMSAQFAAVAQVLIYSGAIVVLFLIVVALLPAGGKEPLAGKHIVGALAAFGSVGMGFIVMLMNVGVLPEASDDAPSVQEVGKPLFHELLVPFELTAPLLLAAIVAAIVLWRRQEQARGEWE